MGIVLHTQMVCVHAHAAVEAPLGSCLLLRQERSWRPSADDTGHLLEGPKAAVWCVENVGATFLACSPEQGSPPGAPGHPLNWLLLRIPLRTMPQGASPLCRRRIAWR
jgi:hypothetical protein